MHPFLLHTISSLRTPLIFLYPGSGLGPQIHWDVILQGLMKLYIEPYSQHPSWICGIWYNLATSASIPLCLLPDSSTLETILNLCYIQISLKSMWKIPIQTHFFHLQKKSYTLARGAIMNLHKRSISCTASIQHNNCLLLRKPFQARSGTSAKPKPR